MEKHFYLKIMDFAREFINEYGATLPEPDGSGLSENEQLIVAKVATLYKEIDKLCPGKGFVYVIAPLTSWFCQKQYTQEW